MHFALGIIKSSDSFVFPEALSAVFVFSSYIWARVPLLSYTLRKCLQKHPRARRQSSNLLFDSAEPSLSEVEKHNPQQPNHRSLQQQSVEEAQI